MLLSKQKLVLKTLWIQTVVDIPFGVAQHVANITIRSKSFSI